MNINVSYIIVLLIQFSGCKEPGQFVQVHAFLFDFFIQTSVISPQGDILWISLS